MGVPLPRVETSADLRGEPSLDAVLSLERVAPIVRPIALALAFKRSGLRPSEVHRILDRIVVDEIVELCLRGTDRATTVAGLATLGVAVARPSVDIAGPVGLSPHLR